MATISGTLGDDILHGTDTHDVIRGLTGLDSLYGGDGHDRIFANQGNDFLYGENGNDHLDGGLGNDTLYGGSGNDTLNGGDGANTLYGGDGNDTLIDNGYSVFLQGGAGKDTYQILDPDSGSTINNYDEHATTSNGDTVFFGEEIQSVGMVAKRWGERLVFDNPTLGKYGILEVQNYFLEDSHTVQYFEFADGTRWDTDHIKSLAIRKSTQGDDLITGFRGNDLIEGLGGNDRIHGMAGNDKIRGGAGDDRLNGDEGNDSIHGGDGHDKILGGAGNDTLIGNHNYDFLFGGEGNDRLSAGADGGSLTGGQGQDVYRFGRGFAQTSIYNYDETATSDNGDTILLTDSTYTPDITLTRIQDDLILGFHDSTDKLSVYKYFSDEGTTSYTVENVQFADGTLWGYQDVLARTTPSPTPVFVL